MKKYLAIVFILLSAHAYTQPLRDINFAYLYDAGQPFLFNLRSIHGEGGFTVLYNLQLPDTTGMRNEYRIEWEGRGMLSDKEGTPLDVGEHVTSSTASGFQGRFTIPAEGAPRYVVAKVVRNAARRAWIFYTTLNADLPVNNFLLQRGAPVLDPWVYTTRPIALGGGGSTPWIVSRYEGDFPAAAPAFSEAQARVSRGMAVDSVFLLHPGEQINRLARGLYLVQKDTTTLQGVAFRAEDDYPQYTKLENLPGPLIYITTKQEYDRLEAARGNKKVFDRVVLGITSDTERARRLMRSYFRRVESANRYFTSYKEGWKTDRGMIYIIFGPPDEVFRFNDREVWGYKNNQFDVRFTFTKSSTLFDPDNFVLIREKKYEDTWYEVVDLWRNARF